MKIEWSDRYQALGMPYPDPKTVCRGQCEGTGFVPTKNGVFVLCPKCKGTGKRRLKPGR